MDEMKMQYCRGEKHVIKEGDTLYQISRMHQVPLHLILRANPGLMCTTYRWGRKFVCRIVKCIISRRCREDRIQVCRPSRKILSRQLHRCQMVKCRHIVWWRLKRFVIWKISLTNMICPWKPFWSTMTSVLSICCHA